MILKKPWEISFSSPKNTEHTWDEEHDMSKFAVIFRDKILELIEKNNEEDKKIEDQKEEDKKEEDKKEKKEENENKKKKKKHKRKKKAKTKAVDDENNDMSESIKDLDNINLFDFFGPYLDVSKIKKIKPNLSQEWIDKLDAELAKDKEEDKKEENTKDEDKKDEDKNKTAKVSKKTINHKKKGKGKRGK